MGHFSTGAVGQYSRGADTERLAGPKATVRSQQQSGVYDMHPIAGLIERHVAWLVVSNRRVRVRFG